MQDPSSSGVMATATETAELKTEEEEEEDECYKCPICMEVMKSAFVTSCGHSFCYICILTHLRYKTDCPSCGHHPLHVNHLFPNFILHKLLKKTSARQASKGASPAEQFRHALQQGCKVSVTELNTLLKVLSDKKSKLEQEAAERSMQILLDFLHCLKKRKVNELNEMQSDLHFIKKDINAVERHRVDLCKAREQFSLKFKMPSHDTTTLEYRSSPANSGRITSSHTAQERIGRGKFQHKMLDGNAQPSSLPPRMATSSCQSSEHTSRSGLDVARKKRVQAKLNDLEECYLQKRRQLANQPFKQDRDDVDMIGREGYSEGLTEFQSVLTTFSQYSRLKVISEFRHGDLFHATNIISSIEFDRDDELFATAGVSKRIKVFDFSRVVNEPADVHCPVVELPGRAKLSCLSWNKFAKNHIASSDYDGAINVWDVPTRQIVMEFEEHDLRAWSVDFSHSDPSMLVSGSDDGMVKIWSMKQEASVLTINVKANICCVKYNPGYNYYVAVGSADNHIHYYDLRNTKQPLHKFSGHKKAVSYVKFMSDNELASASTDSTLRLWDVTQNSNIRTFTGHVNEKNFVGLTANKEFIACGSETNETFVYHKAISRPATWHRFSSPNENDDSVDDPGSRFISSVCWKSDSTNMIAANSQGTIKVLALSP